MTDAPALHAEARAFFDDFVGAFRTFDGHEVARRYRAPYLAVQADGSTVCFNHHGEIELYFQKVIDDYRDKGCSACRYSGFEVVPVGPQAALATVTWHLQRADGEEFACWRESCNLVRVAGKLFVVASIDHAE